jgi:hypothetical protein
VVGQIDCTVTTPRSGSQWSVQNGCSDISGVDSLPTPQSGSQQCVFRSPAVNLETRGKSPQNVNEIPKEIPNEM